jgi:hypothetical protein
MLKREEVQVKANKDTTTPIITLWISKSMIVPIMCIQDKEAQSSSTFVPGAALVESTPMRNKKATRTHVATTFKTLTKELQGGCWLTKCFRSQMDSSTSASIACMNSYFISYGMLIDLTISASLIAIKAISNLKSSTDEMITWFQFNIWKKKSIKNEKATKSCEKSKESIKLMATELFHSVKPEDRDLKKVDKLMRTL